MAHRLLRQLRLSHVNPPLQTSREDFKPSLNSIPAAPTLPPLKLPPFRSPILEADVPFVEPEMLPLPEVAQQPQASRSRLYGARVEAGTQPEVAQL